jgi:hypothetical protein
METEGRGAASAGPSSAVAELTSAEREPDKPEPVAPSRWVRNVNDYTRQVTSEFQGARYGCRLLLGSCSIPNASAKHGDDRKSGDRNADTLR